MIEIKNVSKSFGSFKALDNISFKIGNGEIVGYVGLNGAGKTTTIRIAVGVLNPDSGDVYIDNYSITSDKRNASRNIGWVPEQPVFEPDAKALDYFIYLAGYYGLSPSEARSKGKELLEQLGLGNALYRKLGTYSLGMRKRFALAVSMINDPKNYLFDEVLNGLDPQGIAFFRDLTLRLKKKGCAVLFSSHILSEVENIADRVVFIHKGRIKASLSIDEIRSMAKNVIRLRVEPIDDRLKKILGEYGVVKIREKLVVLEEPSIDQNTVLEILIKNNYRVLEAGSGKYLEEVFFRIIGEEK